MSPEGLVTGPMAIGAFPLIDPVEGPVDVDSMPWTPF